MKILVADDERITRMLLEETLTEWGFEVVSAADGQAAWEALTRPDSPQLAIVDWQMPKMDGVEVCRKVREHIGNALPWLILLTARDTSADIVSGLAHANDYVTKPFDQDVLRARVNVGARVVQAEERLLEMERDRVLAETAGAAAHEMNQPLSILVAMSELLLSKVGADDPIQPHLRSLHDAAERISGIVKKMWAAREYATKPYVRGIQILDFDAAAATGDGDRAGAEPGAQSAPGAQSDVTPEPEP